MDLLVLCPCGHSMTEHTDETVQPGQCMHNHCSCMRNKTAVHDAIIGGNGWSAKNTP